MDYQYEKEIGLGYLTRNVPRENILAAIKKIELSGEGVSPHCSWNNNYSRRLQDFLRLGIVTEEDVRTEIHVHLKKLGRKGFDLHRRTSTPPDRLPSPHAFAYALIHKEFKTLERLRIQFTYRDTIKTFIASYNKDDLCQKVFDQLLRNMKSRSSLNQKKLQSEKYLEAYT